MLKRNYAAAHRVHQLTIVGGYQDRGAERIYLHEQLNRFPTGLLIKVSSGLISYQDGTLPHQGPRNRSALLFTAR